MSARQDSVSSLHQEERCQQDRTQCPPFIRRRDVSKTGLSVLPSSGAEMSARQDSVSSLNHEERCQLDRTQCPPFIAQEERCQQDRTQCPLFIVRRKDVSKTGLSVLP